PESLISRKVFTFTKSTSMHFEGPEIPRFRTKNRRARRKTKRGRPQHRSSTDSSRNNLIRAAGQHVFQDEVLDRQPTSFVSDAGSGAAHSTAAGSCIARRPRARGGIEMKNQLL